MFLCPESYSLTMGATNVAKRYRGKDARDRLIEGERMLERYNNGATVSKLMEEFSYRSRQTIDARLKSAIKERIAPEADAYRLALDATLSDQMARLDEQMTAVDHLIQLGTEQHDGALIERAMVQRLHVIEARIRVVDRRSRLMGLDAPVKADVTMHVETEQDRELAQLVRESKVKAAVQRQEQEEARA